MKKEITDYSGLEGYNFKTKENKPKESNRKNDMGYTPIEKPKERPIGNIAPKIPEKKHD